MNNDIVSPENIVYHKPALLNDVPMHYHDRGIDYGAIYGDAEACQKRRGVYRERIF